MINNTKIDVYKCNCCAKQKPCCCYLSMNFYNHDKPENCIIDGEKTVWKKINKYKKIKLKTKPLVRKLINL